MEDKGVPPKPFVMVVDADGGSLPAEIDDFVREFANKIDAEVVEGEIEACKSCNFFDCVCEIMRTHKEGCDFRTAATCPIEFPCEKHGISPCATCDVCTCGAMK